MDRLKTITTAVTVMLLATGLWAQEHQHGEDEGYDDSWRGFGESGI